MIRKHILRYRAMAYLIIVLAFVAGALSFLVPVAPTVTDPVQAHLRTAAAVILDGLYAGAAIWFWIGMAHFKTRLRVAYILQSVGLVLFSIAMLQLPIFGLFDLWKTAWATGGGAILVFVLSAIPMYLGMRQLAKLAQVKSLVTSVWFVTLISIAAAVAAWAISPHFIRHDMVGAPIYVGAVWCAGSYFFFAGLLARRAMKELGPSYGQALHSQYVAFFFLALCAINEATVVTFMPRTTTFYSVYGIYLWTFIGAGLLFVRASYHFRLLTAAYAPATAANAKIAATDQDYIDSIVSVADLASRLGEINPILDGMRQVTSHLSDTRKLSASDKTRLLEVYSQLEEYLTHQDPLRKFTREQLIDHVTPAFSRLLQRS